MRLSHHRHRLGARILRRPEKDGHRLTVHRNLDQVEVPDRVASAVPVDADRAGPEA